MASPASPPQRCPFSRPQNLKNYESSKEVTDVLLMKSEEPGVCSTTVCNGSVMNIRKMPLEIRPPEEVLTQAKELLDEYYKDIKGFESKEHQARLQEVTQSIGRTGSYDLTYNELDFGAKLAWRNAPRCIGRISWSHLHLFDGRHVKTTKQMYEFMLQHLDYATNGGNIRSTITVFPQRKAGRRDFRVWNQQLLSYAGYEQSDGSFIGDPAYADFTKICQKLGWKGKGGRFDILPWVISTPTGEPDWFSIPEEHIMMVPITHPEYDWFKDLQLKWFAVPAVSSLMMDCGGIQFTAAPFNGWYMASEIGTRDLCDVQRYNMMQVFGEKLGLDTRTTTSLWKDKATLEVNIAVLHSFKEMGVTIVDHHTAAETFMQFHSNEYRQRGGCPADWAWIVPPISGSLTPVFHQEMSLYYLKPAFEYQIPSDVANERQDRMFSGEKRAEGDKPIKKFKKAALAVTFASTLYAGVMARRVRIAIVYATETGKAQSYANTLYNIFSRSFNPQVYNMADYDVTKLSRESLVAVIASTTGVGEPPQTGKKFTKTLYDLREKHNNDGSQIKSVDFWDDYNDVKINGIHVGSEPHSPVITDGNKPLKKKKRGLFARIVKRKPKKKTGTPDDRPEGGNVDSSRYLSSSSLYQSSNTLGRSTNSLFKTYDPASEVSYAVFSLGSTNYEHFCAFGKYLDNMMFTLGGDRLLDVALGDETENQQDTFNDWAAQFLETCCDRFRVEHQSSDVPTSKQIVSGKQVKTVQHGYQQPLAKDLGQLHGKSVETCTVVANNTLHEKGNKWYQNIVINVAKDSTLKYQPGDHVGVFPANSKAMVQGILTKLVNCSEPDQPVQVMLRKLTGDDSWIAHPTLPVTSIRTLLERFLDITSPPSQPLLRLMADAASNNSHSSRLNHLATNIDEYRQWKKWKHPNLLEVLTEFPSVRLDAGLLLCRLPLLQHRLYSISSSPVHHKGQLALTVSSFNYNTEGGKGPLHSGVCTSYIKKTKPGDTIEIFHRSAPEFHLPEGSLEGDAPIILIGAGSGVAPLRGFWQHYHHQYEKNPKGPKRQMTLYYGCQTKGSNLYAEEKQAMRRSKAITFEYLALSRDPKVSKTYVQDLLLVHGKDIYKQLVQRGGHLYICGSEGMSDGVTNSLLTIFRENGKKNIDQAKNMIHKMKEDKRFHEDIFGNGSPM